MCNFILQKRVKVQSTIVSLLSKSLKSRWCYFSPLKSGVINQPIRFLKRVVFLLNCTDIDHAILEFETNFLAVVKIVTSI